MEIFCRFNVEVVRQKFTSNSLSVSRGILHFHFPVNIHTLHKTKEYFKSVLHWNHIVETKFDFRVFKSTSVSFRAIFRLCHCHLQTSIAMSCTDHWNSNSNIIHHAQINNCTRFSISYFSKYSIGFVLIRKPHFKIVFLWNLFHVILVWISTHSTFCLCV